MTRPSRRDPGWIILAAILFAWAMATLAALAILDPAHAYAPATTPVPPATDAPRIACAPSPQGFNCKVKP